MTNELSTERAIEALYTVRAYYASLTAGYPKGKDCRGIGDVMCSEIANSCLMAIQALEQEPCEDAISREELLKKCVYAPIAPVIKGDGVHYEDVVFAKDIINAKPLYPKAKWIPVSENGDKDNGKI